MRLGLTCRQTLRTRSYDVRLALESACLSVGQVFLLKDLPGKR
jgi:hypothetical protein